MKFIGALLIILVLCLILIKGIKDSSKENQNPGSTSFNPIEVSSDEEAKQLEKEANEMKEKNEVIDYEVDDPSEE